MGKIEIKGPIVSDAEQWIYDWFEIPATSPGKVNKALASMASEEDVEIIINSGGGGAFSGSEIYTALKSYSGKVVAKVVGLAASAASIIAMGANEILMSPTAQMMIHRASTYVAGNKNDFEHTAEVLSGLDESIANVYESKTNIPPKDLLDMMSKETWLNAQKAKELGFADGIMFENEVSAVNVLTDNCGMLPQAVIDKMRNELKGKTPGETRCSHEDDVALAKAKLKLTMII